MFYDSCRCLTTLPIVAGRVVACCIVSIPLLLSMRPQQAPLKKSRPGSSVTSPLDTPDGMHIEYMPYVTREKQRGGMDACKKKQKSKQKGNAANGEGWACGRIDHLARSGIESCVFSFLVFHRHAREGIRFLSMSSRVLPFFSQPCTREKRAGLVFCAHRYARGRSVPCCRRPPTRLKCARESGRFNLMSAGAGVRVG